MSRNTRMLAAEHGLEETYQRFLDAIDAGSIDPVHRDRIYNAAMDWRAAAERLNEERAAQEKGETGS